ncbi:MAG: YtxH domain-containing protein [Acidobacteriota bacterium]
MADNGGGDKLVYFLIGAGIGAVTALLFAPKAGAELRAEIADKTRRGLDQARETGVELGEKASELYQTSVERAQELAARSRESVNEVASRSREAVEDLTSRSKEIIDRQKSQISAAIDAGKQGYREAKRTDKASAAFEES